MEERQEGRTKPHKPGSSSTVARWLKTVLNNAGIDRSTFKVHPVRSAATSSATGAGVTTAKTLDAADWATETVFQKKTATYGLPRVDRE